MQAEALELLQIFNNLGQGLVFPSESDYPLEPFFWDIDNTVELTPERITELTGILTEMIETVDFDDFFSRVTQIKDWHSEAEIADVMRFRDFVESLTFHLSDIQVFRIGEIEITVLVVGKPTFGGYAGVKTILIET